MLVTILTLAIALLFTLAGLAAVLAITDSVLKARQAYGQLVREAALLRSGFAFQVEARGVRHRRTTLHAMPARQSPIQHPLPACAAA
jgi:hypothetical protein